MPPEAPSLPRLSPHRHAVAAVVLATLALVMLAVREAWPVAVSLMLTDGLLAGAWAVAMWGIGRFLLPRAWLDGACGPLRVATATAAGIGGTSFLLLGLGLCGWLNGSVAWAILLAGLASTASALVYELRAGRQLRFGVSPGTWLWLSAAPASAVLIAAPAVLPGVLWGDEPHGYDVLSYHLQIPREWFEAGRVITLSNNVFSFFPLSMELHALLAMHLRGGPWAGMYVAQYMHAMTIPLTAIAAYGAVRPAFGSTAATIAAVLALATPWMPMVGTVMYNEGLLGLFATLAFAWATRAGDADAPDRNADARRAILIVGVMAGLAYGAKMTALAVVFAPVAFMISAGGGRWRDRAVRAALFLVVSLVVACPWMLRAAGASGGNPLFPLAAGVFSRGAFSEAQVQRWNAAHAPRDDQQTLVARGRALWDQVLVDWRFGYALLPAALVATALGLRDRRRRAVGAAVFAQVVIWIGFTHLQGRFLTATIPLAAIAVALAPAGVARLVLAGVAGAGALAGGAVLLARVAAVPVGAFGVNDTEALWELHPDAVASVVRDGSRPVALAGDARAFWWPLPKAMLHYRTVFDVDVREGESLIEAWTRGAPPDAAVVVDPNELRRLVATYRGLGPPPADVEGRDAPFLLGR